MNNDFLPIVVDMYRFKFLNSKGDICHEVIATDLDSAMKRLTDAFNGKKDFSTEQFTVKAIAI